MQVQLLATVALSLALGALLDTASCSGQVCPAGQQSCGTQNASNAGAAGSAGAGSCDQLAALRSCLDSFCKTAQNPFCSCYTRGFDLDSVSCGCVTFDAQKFCTQAANNGVDAASYDDCSATSSSVSSTCVGVQ